MMRSVWQNRYPGLGKAAAKIRPFVLFIQSMKAKAKLLSVADLLQEVIETTGYVRELEAEGTDEAEEESKILTN